MAGAGLFKMQPYQWTDTAKLAVEANRNEVAAASAMDKKKPEAKGKGIGGSLGGMIGSIGGAALGSVIPGLGTTAGAMLGGMAGGALGGAMGGGGGAGAATGAGEGLGMGMALGSTGAADSIGKGTQDLFGNTGLSTATDTAGTALKGAGADGNWSHSFTSDTPSGSALNNMQMNTFGITPNSGMQNRMMSPGSMTLPLFSGAR